MSDTQQRLQEIARTVFYDDSLELDDATTAADVAAWDSLAHVNFMFSVESEFDVQFSDEEFVGFQNVGELRRMLDAKLAER